ncbi:MAG TPA: SDR family oxidoreductase [Xanthobacteraceae bacterium]|jgi:3-oxoacyl-[acyl-carrier protein] reductase
MPGQNGKTVIVTGAASGIGFACVQGLLAAGHCVCGADLQPFPAERLHDPARFVEVRADIADESDCRRIAEHAVKTFGALNAMIHMAALHSTSTWRELTAEHFDRTLTVNVTGSFLMARAAAEQMTSGGAIVLTSSGSINIGGVGGRGRGGPAYVASKAAIIGLTRALARSLAPIGIRVNAISPGSTETPMTADYDDEMRRNVVARSLVGRMGRPEDIASVALFLISDAAGYMTGEIVNVNGGGGG